MSEYRIVEINTDPTEYYVYKSNIWRCSCFSKHDAELIVNALKASEETEVSAKAEEKHYDTSKEVVDEAGYVDTSKCFSDYPFTPEEGYQYLRMSSLEIGQKHDGVWQNGRWRVVVTGYESGDPWVRIKKQPLTDDQIRQIVSDALEQPENSNPVIEESRGRKDVYYTGPEPKGYDNQRLDINAYANAKVIMCNTGRMHSAWVDRRDYANKLEQEIEKLQAENQSLYESLEERSGTNELEIARLEAESKRLKEESEFDEKDNE